MSKIKSFVLPITWLSGLEHGWGNGYVAVSEDHPWFNKDYDSINVDIHGGLTFAGFPNDGMPKDVEDMWVVGFDCAHFNDNSTTCPKEYVEAETQRLLEQAENAE